MISNITNVRELFVVIANHFETVCERQPYYNIVRSILKEYGNIHITDVEDDMLQEDEMKLYREILGFAGIVPEVPAEVPVEAEVHCEAQEETDEIPVEIPTETITVTITGRTFTFELPTSGAPEIEIEFKGVKMTFKGCA